MSQSSFNGPTSLLFMMRAVESGQAKLGLLKSGSGHAAILRNDAR